MSFKAASYFTPEALKLARYFIFQNDGNEIVMVGTVNRDGLVYDLRRAAMGNSNSVPAVLATARPGEVLIHNHPSGNLEPSFADVEVAARASEKSVGSYIVDNQLINIFPIVERILPYEKDEVFLDYDRISAVFSKNGTLSKNDDEFEFRRPQVEMALDAAKAINESDILVAEAGTGTGKSFAYLVPLLLYVAGNENKRAVVSTSTIALQEQLFNKDIPILKQKLDIDINVVVLKGRANYLCKRRFLAFSQDSLQTKVAFDAEQNFQQKEKRTTLSEEEMNKLQNWVRYSADGTRSNMNVAVANDIWSEICSDELACEKTKCRFFGECFFQKARRNANLASLILVNHHLLMADVSMKMESEEGLGLLPKFDILVIDEAHNLFKSATSFLCESVSFNMLKKLFGKLYNTSTNQGLLTKLCNNYPNTALQPLENAAEILHDGFLHTVMNSWLPELVGILKKNGEENLDELDDIEIRSSMKPFLGDIADKIMTIVKLVSPVVAELEKRFDDLFENQLKRTTMIDEYNRSLLTDLSSVITKLEGIAEFFTKFYTDNNTESQVFWGEEEQKSLTLTISPLNVQKILEENLYSKIRTIIFTSATLTAGQGTSSFDFFFRESGLALSERNIRAVSLESCFDHASKVRAFVAKDMPSPLMDKEHFETVSAIAARKLAEASGGGALVLFTSISHRDSAAKYFSGLNFNVISQGKLPPSTIIKNFRDDVNATLLATETFWEGIDMKGDTLRNLIIVKLPFRYPSHPFIKRYVRKLEQETGGSSFLLYTLPNAVLKFKQGFGRLIRTKNDRGTITVLDRRVFEKSYGRDFLRSVPEGVEFKALPTDEIAYRIEEFFGRND